MADFLALVVVVLLLVVIIVFATAFPGLLMIAGLKFVGVGDIAITAKNALIVGAVYNCVSLITHLGTSKKATDESD
jgi:hypothetical protein